MGTFTEDTSWLTGEDARLRLANFDNAYYAIKGIIKAFRKDAGCQGHDECTFDGCQLADAIEDVLDKVKGK